jgi:2-polyprenyl-3-methyl-5-hydroxy-6-metoxy-1,4-benzoquinol methylase
MLCTLCYNDLRQQIDKQHWLCENCGAYLKDTAHYLDPEAEQGRYELHNNDINDAGYIHFLSPIINAVLQDFKPEHQGLDYGCGAGPAITHVLRQSGYTVQLYDPYFHPDLDYLNLTYDYIFSCEVFEHFYKPKQEIEKLIGLLKPGGKLYIMTHLFDAQIQDFPNWYYKKDPTHVFIYTEQTMRFIAQRYQLVLEKIEGRLIVFGKS